MKQRWGRQGGRTALAAIAVCAATLAATPATEASVTTIGATDLNQPLAETVTCTATCIAVAEPRPGGNYVAPSDGHIVAVRLNSGADNPDVALVTLRDTGAGLIAQGSFSLGPASASGVTSYATHIPVSAGDILALEPTPDPRDNTVIKLYTAGLSITRILTPGANPTDPLIPRVIGLGLPAVQFDFEPLPPPAPPPPTPQADLAVANRFVGGPSPPRGGARVTFTVEVTNEGPDSATGVTVAERFGDRLAFDKARVAQGPAAGPPCRVAGTRRLSCGLGALEPDGRVVLNFVFRVRAWPVRGGKGLGTVATVSATGPGDPDATDNEARAGVGRPGAGCPRRRIVGTIGKDALLGTARAETLLGRPGDDRMNGRRGRDCLFGQQGDDYLNGGPQSDKIYGGAGDDTIMAADDTRDVVRCGPGRHDWAIVDQELDRVASDCESVRRV